MNAEIIEGYKIKRPLGQGTFGQTWLVEKDGEEFALKLFKNEMIRSRTDMKRIEREIATLKEVNHRNVIRYVSDGIFQEGFDKYHYLVMQYADGEPLSNFIQRHGKLTVAQTQRIAVQILDGIKAIHDAGLYHRDLKPDNIYVTRLGDVRILDFGLVKLLDASTLTATGVPMGTYAYMAPEQLQDSKNIDYRADLYSFGAILFHMITGRIPIEIHTLVEAPYKILNEVPPFASSINPVTPTKLDDMIAILLEKELHRRNYTIDELRMEFRDLEDRTLPTPSADLTLKFLPRLLHNERSVVEQHVRNYQLDGIVFPANFFPKYSAVYNSVRDAGKFALIDPVVYRLAYSKFSNTESLVKLPYVLSSLNKESPADFEDVLVCQNRAKHSLDWQLSQEPSVLVSPFHYSSGLNDDWLTVDQKVFRECRKYLNEIGETRPLYAGTSIQIEGLTGDDGPTRLVNTLTRTQADGYILMFDIQLDSFNKAHYYAFAKIVSMLGDVLKPIVLSRVNDFGLGLMSIGATAISSGIGFIEDFKESILIEEGLNFSLKPKYYVPELLASYNEKALKDILEPAIGKHLACNCPYCNGSTDVQFLMTPAVAKGHYLWQKQRQVELLKLMGKPERLRWFVDAVQNATFLSRDLKKASKSKYISNGHLSYWIDALRAVSDERKILFPSVGQ